MKELTKMPNRVLFVLSNFTSFNCGMIAFYFFVVKDSWWGLLL